MRFTKLLKMGASHNVAHCTGHLEAHILELGGFSSRTGRRSARSIGRDIYLGSQCQLARRNAVPASHPTNLSSGEWRVEKTGLYKVNENNGFPLISGGRVALNRGSDLRRFNETFPPNIKGKTLPQRRAQLTQVLL